MELPQDFVSRNGIGTLGGSSVAVLAVTAFFGKVLPTLDPRWVAVPLSLAFGIGVAAPMAKDWLDYVIGFVNGCLIFLTATGANQAAGKAEDKARGAKKPSEEPFAKKRENRIFRPWFA